MSSKGPGNQTQGELWGGRTPPNDQTSTIGAIECRQVAEIEPVKGRCQEVILAERVRVGVNRQVGHHFLAQDDDDDVFTLADFTQADSVSALKKMSLGKIWCLVHLGNVLTHPRSSRIAMSAHALIARLAGWQNGLPSQSAKSPASLGEGLESLCLKPTNS